MSGTNPKPSESQKRGYRWLTMVLMAVALVMILVARCGGDRSDDADGVMFAEQVGSFRDSIGEAQRIEDSIYRSGFRKDSRSAVSFGNDGQHMSAEVHVDSSRHTHVASVRKELYFELNAADTTDLQQLRGIGPVFARRIVKYRQLLGGYARMEQLKEVYGMTEELYDKIRPFLTIDPSGVKKIEVNSATIDELKRHPYLDYYQAKAIVNFRKSGVCYGSLDDLAKVNLLDDETLCKIAPYIQY